MSTKTKQNTTTGGGHPMTHHETHGKNCICHSCQPVKVIDVIARQIAEQHQAKSAAPKVQPRGARR